MLTIESGAVYRFAKANIKYKLGTTITTDTNRPMKIRTIPLVAATVMKYSVRLQ